MSNLFLINEAISNSTFNVFKVGMVELIAIERNEDDDFCKHESVYNLENYIELFSNSGQYIQEIVRFIGKLSPINEYINNEERAIKYSNGKKHAFLGIDFSGLPINTDKQIINADKYIAWSNSHLSNFNKLLNVLDNYVLKKSFEREFKGLRSDVQISIIEDFQKAKNRKLKTHFYPDTKIVGDVTPSNAKCSVYELRVYTPIALRVYFCEEKGKVYISNIEQKSNPDQSEDIKKAHKALNELINR